MFGIGGGILFVPFQIVIYTLIGIPEYLQMKLAIATSLFATACTTFASTRAHAHHGGVIYALIYRGLAGIVLGAFFGSFLGRFLSATLLEVLFGLLLCSLAVYFYFFCHQPEKGEHRLPNFFLWNFITLGIGTFAAMLGIGGGFLTIPILLFFHVSLRKAVGTAAAFGFVLSSVGSIGYLLPNLQDEGYAYTLGYIYLPALIPLATGAILTARWGAYLAHNLPLQFLKRCFAVILLIIGILLIAR